MAHGKIRVNTLTYDTGSGDVDVAVSGIPSASDMALKAPLASPALTGTPTAPTASQGTDTTQVATTAFVNAEIAADLTAAIGSTVQAFDADTTKNDVANTFTAAQTLNAGLTVDGPYKQAAETVGALDIDLSTGNYFTKSISTSSTVTFSNPPASGTVGSFILELTLTGTGTAITWPNGTGGQGTVYWNGDTGTTAPTLVDARTHLFLFVTSDGGTKYRGAVLKDYTA
jgi:hypothetical protein